MNKISNYDENYIYNGYVLVNELYEDDEGFYKNTYQWGLVCDDYIKDIQILRGLSSNSYASMSEAISVFKELVDSL